VEHEGLIYVVGVDGWPYTKIGFTKGAFAARLAVIQTGCPLRIVPWLVWKARTKRDEMALHKAFAPWHLQGEWYHDCEPIRLFCQSLMRHDLESVVTFTKIVWGKEVSE